MWPDGELTDQQKKRRQCREGRRGPAGASDHCDTSKRIYNLPGHSPSCWSTARKIVAAVVAAAADESRRP